jgi:hypothetical protein
MKITPDHLARGAFIYVRQSTADQLANNHESRRRQYGLADRARVLGWTDVTVIDDDLGRSGSGVSRPGFERLLAAICEGRVGAVFAIEASRLARNGRDWHTLIEFCGLVGTMMVDEDGVYDARHPNDRLLLGMKGTMGELFSTVAVGYARTGRGKIEMEPNLRVREAIGVVFSRFAEMQSIRQVFLSLRADRIELPYIDRKDAEQARLMWKRPVYSTVNNLLTNPVYAGAYAFGRTGSRTTIEKGRKRVLRGHRKDRSEWAVLLVDHHEGYLSWADYERNQRLIADNTNAQGHDGARRSPQWRGFAGRPSALRALRAEAACQLQRHQGRHRPLQLRRGPEQPQCRSLHLVWLSTGRRGSGRRDRAATAASRLRGGDTGCHGLRAPGLARNSARSRLRLSKRDTRQAGAAAIRRHRSRQPPRRG